MAPRQLRLEPIEVDMSAEQGSKRVRSDINDESSTQVRLRTRVTAYCTSWHCPALCWVRSDHWPELRLLAREVSAA
eukprot:scaffold3808_cov112-Isochrysis_galbana.AAC.54